MDGSESTELNVDEKDKIFIIQENPYFVAIVYPQKNRLDAKGASARPGVVVKTARMTKKGAERVKVEKTVTTWSSSDWPSQKITRALQVSS